jgi:hypothetical protein
MRSRPTTWAEILCNQEVGKTITLGSSRRTVTPVPVAPEQVDIPAKTRAIHGVDYLKRVNLREGLPGRRSRVIGGNVIMVPSHGNPHGPRRLHPTAARAEMPASPEEIGEAKEEGIRFEFVRPPASEQDGKVPDECPRGWASPTPAAAPSRSHRVQFAAAQRPVPPWASLRLGVSKESGISITSGSFGVDR